MGQIIGEYRHFKCILLNCAVIDAWLFRSCEQSPDKGAIRRAKKWWPVNDE
jgi:hypothetical protein